MTTSSGKNNSSPESNQDLKNSDRQPSLFTSSQAQLSFIGWHRNTIISFQEILIAFLLTFTTILVYYPVIGFDFINLDTPEYVYNNPHVTTGLNLDNFFWALTATDLGNWHPVTWLSHMLDIELFGTQAGFHHLSSLFLHISNTLLVFIIFKSLTGQSHVSALISALFSLHPLHIESVVWIAERKDLLSSFFGLLSVLMYLNYVKKKKSFFYLLVSISYLISLMSKPMLVTLPFLLILLDFWPLNRTNISKNFKKNKAITKETPTRYQLKNLVIEKTPFFILSLLSCIITLEVQIAGGAMNELEHISILQKINTVVIAYTTYLYNTLIPLKLSIFYPFNEIIHWGSLIFSGLLLAFTTICSLLYASRYPWFLTGWFWYLGTLVPVIGIVSIGLHSMADRYTYIPLLGIFMILSLTVHSLLKKNPRPLLSFWIILTLMLVSLSYTTRQQLSYWENSETLFRRSIAVTQNNYIAHQNLGKYLISKGRYTEAEEQLKMAISQRNDFAVAYINLGIAYSMQQKSDLAIKEFQKAIKNQPDDALPYCNIGNEYYRTNNISLATQYYLEALRYDPLLFCSYYGLAMILESQGNLEKAEKLYLKTTVLNPEFRLAQEAIIRIHTIKAKGEQSQNIKTQP